MEGIRFNLLILLIILNSIFSSGTHLEDVLRRDYRKIEQYYSVLGESIFLDFFVQGGICDT